MNNIIQSLQKDYLVLNQYNNLKPDSEIIIDISQYTLYFSLDYIQICFSENKPFQHRNPFIKTISDLAEKIPYFDQIIYLFFRYLNTIRLEHGISYLLEPKTELHIRHALQSN